jgi:hypothetical protein
MKGLRGIVSSGTIPSAARSSALLLTVLVAQAVAAVENHDQFETGEEE